MKTDHIELKSHKPVLRTNHETAGAAGFKSTKQSQAPCCSWTATFTAIMELKLDGATCAVIAVPR
jgi:hypothetical protein